MKADQVVTKDNVAQVEKVIRFLVGDDLFTDPLSERLYALAAAVEAASKKAEAETLDVPTWKRKYLESEGQRCPFCGEVNLEGSKQERDYDYISVNMHCTGCDRRWIDVYTLSDIQVLPREEKG